LYLIKHLEDNYFRYEEQKREEVEPIDKYQEGEGQAEEGEEGEDCGSRYCTEPPPEKEETKKLQLRVDGESKQQRSDLGLYSGVAGIGFVLEVHIRLYY